MIIDDLQRREFIKGGTALAAMGLAGCSSFGVAGGSGRIPHLDVAAYTRLPAGGKWRRGNLHMHTIRSDGNSLPIDAASLYKRAGYDFICITDHNVTAAEPFKEFSRTSKRGKKLFVKLERDIAAMFPGRVAYSCRKQGKDEMVVPTDFDTWRKAIEEPERFLVISGNEITAAPTKGDEVHCGAVNFRKPLRANNNGTVDDCFRWMKTEYEKLGGNSAESLFILNHPLWVSYDIPPRLAGECADLRFFEVCNFSGTPRFGLPPGNDFTHDKWWDVVNTMRLNAGMPLIYGIGSDDVHTYGKFLRTKTPILGYTRVLTAHLTTEEILEAMYLGNFYATTGMELESVKFDRAKKTLSVRVADKFADDCVISFIGTKKGVDTKVREVVEWDVNSDLKNPWIVRRHFRTHRKVERFSPDIGKVLKVVKGREASYTMQDDDLYVRAKVVTSAGVRPEDKKQDLPIAWTQPVQNA